MDREVTRLYYDGLGRRLAKEYDPEDGSGGVKRTEYVFDGLDPVAEYRLWNGQRTEYYRGGLESFSPTPMLLEMRNFVAQAVSLQEAEGQAYWYHLDGRGSVAGLTKHQGQSTHNYRYDAYGQVLPAQGNWTDPHNYYTFLGKEWDEHLGLYEFGFRLYDPWAGVWLTREPLPGRAWEPRTWHRYQYAFASPISYYDPYGMQGGPTWLDRLGAEWGGQLDRFARNLGSTLDTSASYLGHALDTAARLPTGAQCTPSANGYSPWKADLQALWILPSWFFEVGPEVQWYGPESPFTQILKHHMGVQKARAKWAAAGYPPVFNWPFAIEEAASTPWAAFFQENINLLLSFTPFASPTPEGPINPLGGVVGSYEVRIIDLGDGTALFLVENETDWKSGTRIPGTPSSFLPELTREETDVFINLAVATDIFLSPTVVAAPGMIPGVLGFNRGMWELSRIVPGGWGGFGGKMTQYYYWVEPIQSNGFR